MSTGPASKLMFKVFDGTFSITSGTIPFVVRADVSMVILCKQGRSTVETAVNADMTVYVQQNGYNIFSVNSERQYRDASPKTKLTSTVL